MKREWVREGDGFAILKIIVKSKDEVLEISAFLEDGAAMNGISRDDLENGQACELCFPAMEEQ